MEDMQAFVHPGQYHLSSLGGIGGRSRGCSLLMFDSNMSVTTAKALEEVMVPYCAMIPLMLKHSGQFNHLGQNLIRKWM